MEKLRRTIRHCPIIDNHAHNLSSHLTFEKFYSITSETENPENGEDSTSLAHLHATKELASLHGTSPDWKHIVNARQRVLSEEHSSQELIQDCFRGTYQILMDDGYEDANRIKTYMYHDQFTTAPTRRVVRVEAIAEDLLEEQIVEMGLRRGVEVEDWSIACGIFYNSFTEAITEAIEDPNVAGFKSIIAYNTGLAVNVGSEKYDAAFEASFADFLKRLSESDEIILDNKAINDFIVCRTIELLNEASTERLMELPYPFDPLGCVTPAYPPTKPFQFHTGFSGERPSLDLFNPVLLQPLIRMNSYVPFILLHAAYPFTKEAGYLASIHTNAYLDIGLVFMRLSRKGRLRVLHDAMEMAPYRQLLYSTDGNVHPETYWLSNKWGREAMEKVLTEYVSDGDLTEDEAISAAQCIFFENANQVYVLGHNVDLESLTEERARVQVKKMAVL